MKNTTAEVWLTASTFLRLTPHASRLAASSMAVVALLLTSCGFQLRGQAALPFESMYVQTGGPSSFASQLARAVRAGSQTRVIDNQQDAQVTLQIIAEARERTILSLSGGGRVREITLRYRVSYRLYDRKNKEHIAPSEILLRRDLSYSDSDVIAKEQEEGLLYRDMLNDAVQQLVRRLQITRIDS